MTLFQFDPHRAPDSDFSNGDIQWLHKGNLCRLLDERRTPGIVEDYFPNSAQFRWRITAFEDAGNAWDLPAEYALRMQFAKDSVQLSETDTQDIRNKIQLLDKSMEISAAPNQRKNSLHAIEQFAVEGQQWLLSHLRYLRNSRLLDFNLREGNSLLMNDCTAFLSTVVFRTWNNSRPTTMYAAMTPANGSRA